MTAPSADREASIRQLALALWTWDAAGLEPGETAIYTSGSPADQWISVVAGWRSLRDVIRLELGEPASNPRNGVIDRGISEPQEAVNWLTAELRRAPGVVAAVFTAEPMAADVILEALPMWARIVLAMPASKPATVDFYNNVHRKGARLLSVPGSPDELVDSPWSDAAAIHLDRARRILGSNRLVAQCPR